MPTPYEEISEVRAGSGNIKTDANLALDSLMLGGIEAEDYATKVYVEAVKNFILNSTKGYTDQECQTVLNAAKEYTNTVVRNIDYSSFATKADLQAAINNAINECKTYVNNAITSLNIGNYETKAEHNQDMTELNAYINQIYQELFQSVSSGKSKIAAAVTDKGVQTAADATFDTMATNIRAIETGGSGGSDTYDATATADKILEGYTAYAGGQKLIGTYRPSSIIIDGGGDVDPSTTPEAGNLIYGKAPTEAQNILSGYSNIVTGDDGFNVVYQNETIYIGNPSTTDKINNHVVKKAYTFTDLGIPSGSEYMGMQLSPLIGSHYLLTFAVKTSGTAYVYIFTFKNEPYNDGEDNYEYRIYDKEINGITVLATWKLTVLLFERVVNISSISVIWDLVSQGKILLGVNGSSAAGYYGGALEAFFLESQVSNIETEATYHASVLSTDYNGLNNYHGFQNAEMLTDRLIAYRFMTKAGIIVLTDNAHNPSVLKDSSLSDISAISPDTFNVVLSTGAVKTLSINYTTGDIDVIDQGKTLGMTGFTYGIFDSTGEYMLIKDSSNSYLVKIDTSANTLIQDTILTLNTTDSYFTQGRESMIATVSGTRKIIKFKADYENVVGITYQGQVFVIVKEGMLTATAANVTNGRTFIGYSGGISIGTMGGGSSE